jgi:2-keto-4-pentenoate hydratase
MDRHKDAARLLLSARRDPSQRLRAIPEVMAPKTAEQAMLIQREIMADLGPIGGWKVGSPSPDGPCNCSPMPLSGIHASGALIEGTPMRGVEAEIAVLMAHDLPVREAPYAREDVLRAVASAHPAIEVLQSRFVDPDQVEPLSQLADSLAHGAFVHGSAVPHWQEVDLAAEEVALLVDGHELKRRQGNPAGDMVRLLVWLANEGARWAGGLKAGQWVTTGSWTGKDYVPPGARVEARFAKMGSAAAAFPGEGSSH